MKKYLLFDLDGTVIDSEEGVTKCAQYALENLGINEDLKNLRRFIGPPLSESFKTYYGLNDNQIKFAIKKFRERYDSKGTHECSLYEGIRELLELLSRSDKIVCLATSKANHAAINILNSQEIIDLFDMIVGATDDGSISSKSDVIRKIMSMYPEAKADEFVMIGDTRFDIEGAKECEIDCIGVEYGFAEKGELQDAQYIVKDVKALGELLENI